MYTSNDIKIVGKSYQTKDGKYHTRTFTGGYAYWYENDEKQGHTSYDYLFFIGKEGVESALKVLNKVISL